MSDRVAATRVHGSGRMQFHAVSAQQRINSIHGKACSRLHAVESSRFHLS